MKSKGWIILVVIVGAVVLYDRGKEQQRKDEVKRKTPAEVFLEDHKNTVTSHGKIDPKSVHEKDGRVFYVTDDGTLCSVIMTYQPEGYYMYSDPRKE